MLPVRVPPTGSAARADIHRDICTQHMAKIVGTTAPLGRHGPRPVRERVFPQATRVNGGCCPLGTELPLAAGHDRPASVSTQVTRRVGSYWPARAARGGDACTWTVPGSPVGQVRCDRWCQSRCLLGQRVACSYRLLGTRWVAGPTRRRRVATVRRCLQESTGRPVWKPPADAPPATRTTDRPEPFRPTPR
jgi:hypothetical protein